MAQKRPVNLGMNPPYMFIYDYYILIWRHILHYWPLTGAGQAVSHYNGSCFSLLQLAHCLNPFCSRNDKLFRVTILFRCVVKTILYFFKIAV